MIVEGQLIEINGASKRLYLDKGYTYKKGEPLYVRAEDLTPGSDKEILVECDYCGKKYYTTYHSYYNGTLNGVIKKCACDECLSQKIKECNLVKYGVESTAQLPPVREKYINTCLERYGVINANQTDFVKQKKINKSLEKYGTINVFQADEIKEKSKQTIRDKYGVDNIMHLPEIRKKCHSALEYVNGRPVSKEQKRIAKLFGGELNAIIDKYRADILLDDMLIVEYDSTGHGLEVQIGRISLDDYNEREDKRIDFMLGKGYKIIRFVHMSKTKISDEHYLDILDKSKLILKNQSYITYDFDMEKFLLNSSHVM